MRSSGTLAPLRLRTAALTCSPRGLARQLRHNGHPLHVEAGVSCEEQGLTQTTGWQRPLQPCKPHSASLQRLSQNTHHGGFPKATGKHATLQVFQHKGYHSLAQREMKLLYPWRGRALAPRAAPVNLFTHEQGQLLHLAPTTLPTALLFQGFLLLECRTPHLCPSIAGQAGSRESGGRRGPCRSSSQTSVHCVSTQQPPSGCAAELKRPRPVPNPSWT